MKHFLKLGDVSAQEMQDIFELADQLKYEKKARHRAPAPRGQDAGYDLPEVLHAHARFV